MGERTAALQIKVSNALGWILLLFIWLPFDIIVYVFCNILTRHPSKRYSVDSSLLLQGKSREATAESLALVSGVMLCVWYQLYNQ